MAGARWIRIQESAVGAWPAGPGYWGVFAHADVKRVLRDPQTFSSHLGGTQVLTRMPHIRPDGDPVRLTSNFQNGLKHLPVRWD